MALNRITGLGMALGTSMLVALACDSGGTTTGNPPLGGQGGGTSQNSDTGGAINSNVGGSTSSNTKATGGAITSSTGGKANNGGTSAASTAQPANCASLTPPTATGSLSVTSGYVTVGSKYKGYGFTWTGKLSNTDTCVTPKCGDTGCVPAFGATALCGAGVVAMDSTYNSIAGVGFNLNQAQSGTNTPVAVAAGSTITVGVSFTDASSAGNAAARVQIVNTADESYCVEAGTWTPDSPIDITSFNTHCWNTTEDGAKAFSATDTIVSVHIIVPSDSTTDRPFSFCLTSFDM